MVKTDENMASQKQKIIDLLEKEVMPILCNEVETKFDKLDAEVVLSVEHIPGHPLSVILHCKDESGNGLVTIPLENRSTKKPLNHGAKWNKSHLKKLRNLCDERTQIDIIARNLKRSSSSVLGRLQLIAKEEMWAYQYLVDSYLPVRYYKD